MKRALITSLTRGIGKQIGFDLLKKGYKVIFNGKTSESINLLKTELKQTAGYSILKAPTYQLFRVLIV